MILNKKFLPKIITKYIYFGMYFGIVNYFLKILEDEKFT